MLVSFYLLLFGFRRQCARGDCPVCKSIRYRGRDLHAARVVQAVDFALRRRDEVGLYEAARYFRVARNGEVGVHNAVAPELRPERGRHAAVYRGGELRADVVPRIDGVVAELPRVAVQRRRVVVDGDERVRLVRMGDLGPVVKRREGVVLARHHHDVAASPQLVPHGLRQTQVEVLLRESARRHRAGVAASVAGVDHDEFIPDEDALLDLIVDLFYIAE